MIYTLTSTTPPCLFTGDHLFLAGCGKPPPQLMRFLLSTIKVGCLRTLLKECIILYDLLKEWIHLLLYSLV